MNIARTLGAAGLGATLLLAPTLVACGSSDEAAPAASDSSAASADTAEAAHLTLTDPWVKAADSGMTAVFGTLHNDGDQPIVVTSASSDISDMMELHETVQQADGSMGMQPKEGGFTIPAGGDHVLEPGGDHIMVMDLKNPLKAGDKVTVTLTLEDGSTVDVTADAKDFSGANETYQGGGMDMSGSPSTGSMG